MQVTQTVSVNSVVYDTEHDSMTHTPSSRLARFSYAIEGTLFISAQLSSNVVSAL